MTHVRAALYSKFPLTLLLAGLVLLTAGCATTKSDTVLIADARAAIVRFVDSDPGLRDWVDHAHGYAVFPGLGKGGLGVGGAYGNGIVFERGDPIGRSRLIQGTVGFQIGAQNFAMVVFFQDEAALTTFQRGNFEFSAQASAVAATAGASADADYENGVAVFTMEEGGLMFEASIGGQKFSFNRW